MLEPRRTRVTGFVSMGAILVAAVAAKGCSSEPKRPEAPSKTSGPATAKGDTAPSKPGAPAGEAKKPVEVASAKADPAPAPAPVAKAEEPPAPVKEGEPTPPPKPPVGIEPPPPPPEFERAPAVAPEPKKPEPAKPAPVEVKKPEPKKPEPVKPAPVEPVKPVPVEVKTPPVEATRPAPVVKSAEQMAIEDAEKELKALSDEKRIAIEKSRFLAEEYATMGEAAYRGLEYEKAKEWALKSLEQRGDNPAARDLLNRARTALGERTGDVADTAARMATEKRVKMEQAETRVKALYNQGKSQMGGNDFRGAISSFEQARTIVLSDPYGIAWGDLSSHIDARLAEARAAHERAAEEARIKAAADAYTIVKQQALAEARARVEKMNAIVSEAITAFDREEFSRCETLSLQALDMEPTNSRVKDLLAAARRARHGQTVEATRKLEKERFREWRLDMQESMIPSSKIVQGPSAEYWDRITRLRKNLGQITGGADESPDSAALRNRLAEEKTGFELDGQTLSQAVTFLSARHGVNIVIDEQVRGDADAQPLPSIKLADISLGDALSLLLRNVAGLTYRIRGNVVLVTRPELAREAPVVKVHPVGDLTMKINDFVAPNLILKPAGAEADENAPQFGAQQEGKQQYGGAEDLVALIRENVGENPDVWNAEGTTCDAQGENNILVVAEPALQEAVDRFLNDLRKFSGIVVNIESRFLSVSDNFLRDVGVDIRGLGGHAGNIAVLDDVTNGLEDGASAGLDNGGVGVPANASGKPTAGAFFNDNSDGDYRLRNENIFDRSLATTLSNAGGAVMQWTLLDDTQVSLIWRAVQKKQEARVLQSPNLTVYNTQRANITLINQLAFVQDFDVEVAQTAFIADPIVSIIQDGLALDVRPTVSNDRRYVTLQLQPTIATLQRPMRTFTTSLGAFTTPVTLQLPEINIQKAQTTVRVPNGGTLLIGGLKNLSQVDLKSETPWLSKIPVVSFFFTRQASSQEFNNLLILIKARITDLSEEQGSFGTR